MTITPRLNAIRTHLTALDGLTPAEIKMVTKISRLVNELENRVGIRTARETDLTRQTGKLTENQRVVLSNLAGSGHGLTATELAPLCGIIPRNTGRTLQSLAMRGLVFPADIGDGNTYYSTSDKGEGLATHLANAPLA